MKRLYLPLVASLCLLAISLVGVVYSQATVRCEDLRDCKQDNYTCYCATSSWNCSGGSAGWINCCDGFTHVCKNKSSGGGGGPGDPPGGVE